VLHILFQYNNDIATTPHQGLTLAFGDVAAFRGTDWLHTLLSPEAYLTPIRSGQGLSFANQHKMMHGIPLWNQPWFPTLSRVAEHEEVFIVIDGATYPHFDPITFETLNYPDPPLDSHICVYDDSWTKPRHYLTRLFNHLLGQ
jgi:hypothetical protein